MAIADPALIPVIDAQPFWATPELLFKRDYVEVASLDPHNASRDTDADDYYLAAARFAGGVSRLIAPMFGVTDQHTLSVGIRAAACFDHYCRTIDWFTDRPHPSINSLHTGTLMLARGVALASTIVIDPPRFWRKWEGYLREASLAERSLWECKHTVKSYDETMLDMLGQKNAVMKIVPALFAASQNAWDRLAAAELAVNRISTAVQLVDDLFDWREDLRAKTYTYPLVLAASCGDLTNEDIVAERIFCRGIAIRVLSMIEKYVNEGLKAIEAFVDPTLVEELTRSLRATRQALEEHSAGPPNLGESALRHTLHPALCYAG